MKTRVLRTVVGLAAVLGSLLVASPAQATNGPASARVYTEGSSGSGGLATASLTFVNASDVTFRNVTVRDVCPGDNRPVKVYIRLVSTLGHTSSRYVGSDTNGCGSDGTNFGTVYGTAGFTVAKAGLTVCLYTSTPGQEKCVNGAVRDNQHVG
ncbi:hypothetical protein [Kribbella deserti]|uniref:Spore-associated protein A n=1 Tax=Kribbella deserti TaxID=1926257 RepID=A0ABV6QQG5_9ACTN